MPKVDRYNALAADIELHKIGSRRRSHTTSWSDSLAEWKSRRLCSLILDHVGKALQAVCYLDFTPFHSQLVYRTDVRHAFRLIDDVCAR